MGGDICESVVQFLRLVICEKEKSKLSELLSVMRE